MDYFDYISMFDNKLNLLDDSEKGNGGSWKKIGFDILSENNNKLASELEEIKKQLEQQKEICQALEEKLNDKKEKQKKKVKKPKYNKRIEKKVIDLIITYRKTTKEIKDILKEENDIILSDRSINEIKKNNNIKGHTIVVKSEPKKD